MAHTLSTTPNISHVDRIGLTIFFALVLHAIVILGVTFSHHDGRRASSEMLEITLAQTPSQKKIDDPDYLAQANQEGGGTTHQRVKDAGPVPAVPSTENFGMSEITRAPSRKTQTSATTPQKRLLTVESIQKYKIPKSALTPLPSEETPSTAELLRHSKEIAILSAKVEEDYQAYTQRPKRQYISSRTSEHRFAAYQEAWRSKVEQIGNLNYPSEAKRRNITGTLLLEVGIKPDGSIEKITMRRSSGHKILDDAAVRIVHLAAPFAPFPPEISADTDILYITRTWQFTLDNEIQAGQ